MNFPQVSARYRKLTVKGCVLPVNWVSPQLSHRRTLVALSKQSVTYRTDKRVSRIVEKTAMVNDNIIVVVVIFIIILRYIILILTYLVTKVGNVREDIAKRHLRHLRCVPCDPASDISTLTESHGQARPSNDEGDLESESELAENCQNSLTVEVLSDDLADDDDDDDDDDESRIISDVNDHRAKRHRKRRKRRCVPCDPASDISTLTESHEQAQARPSNDEGDLGPESELAENCKNSLTVEVLFNDLANANDDDVESRIISEFLHNTCPILELSEARVQAAAVCAAEEVKGDVIPLITGSVAEFYIRPMLSCVGDIDIMYHCSNELAIPQGCSPPLPVGSDIHVDVFEIIDCEEFPCYVYLRYGYLLTKDSGTGEYKARRDTRYPAYVPCNPPNEDKQDTRHPKHMPFNPPTVMPALSKINGPAYTIPPRNGELSVDKVTCIRCFSWPSQAADWPIRRRNYGWPDSATVDRVVSNGCDVVRKTHYQCKKDKRKKQYQCRLSFSRAEITLLNSWSKEQQIVYHVLRMFVKTDETLANIAKRVMTLKNITDDQTITILSNYYIKTLMMWACEMTSNEWWFVNFNIVRICVKLLHILGHMFHNKYCPHYFVNSCIIIDPIRYCSIIETMSLLDEVASHLASITKSWFSTWLVSNYLRQCARLCPEEVSRLFDDVSSSVKLQNAISAVSVVDYRCRNMEENLMRLIITNLANNCKDPLNVELLFSTVNEWKNIDSANHHEVTAGKFLHIAGKITQKEFDDKLLDDLATTVTTGLFVCTPRHTDPLSSASSLRQAVELMKVVANNSRSTVQLIEIELSKAYLYRALRCKDCDSNSIYCLAHVYLAVLYYTTGQYQTAINHCTLVTNSQDHLQCSSHIEEELLPKTDSDIVNAVGLAVFYQYLRTAVRSQQPSSTRCKRKQSVHRITRGTENVCTPEVLHTGTPTKIVDVPSDVTSGMPGPSNDVYLPVGEVVNSLCWSSSASVGKKRDICAFTCSKCGSSFVNRRALNQHDRHVHPRLARESPPANLNLAQQPTHVGVFTTELFARYLLIRCLTLRNCHQLTQMASTDEVLRCMECAQQIRILLTNLLTNDVSDKEQLFVADVLLVKLLKSSYQQICHYKSLSELCQNSTTNATEFDTSELVRLLQQSAVEHLTITLNAKASSLKSNQREASCDYFMTTTDYEALYAYKCGNYQQCLQLSTQNVDTLLYADGHAFFNYTRPNLIQLLDDDIVALTALTQIVNPEFRNERHNIVILQLTMSLYLVAQCQMKLRQSVTSLAKTMNYIEYRYAQHMKKSTYTLDQLTLKLLACKIISYLKDNHVRRSPRYPVRLRRTGFTCATQ